MNIRDGSNSLIWLVLDNDKINGKLGNKKKSDPKAFMLWYDALGYLRSTIMGSLLENSHGYIWKNLNILYPMKIVILLVGKLVVRPSSSKIDFKSPSFL